MGQCESCFRRCFGFSKKLFVKRRYLRTHYTERNYSIEFENLMDEDEPQDEMQKPLTDYEKSMLTSRQYDAIVHEQKRVDAALEAEIAKQEEEIRAEEEAFYEAKREAARIAKLQKERAAKHSIPMKKSWLGDDEDDWQVAGGEDDFEMFLANVKARSIASRERLGSGDGQSTSSSHTRDKSHDVSSVEMEWDHQADVTAPIISQHSDTETISIVTDKSRTDSLSPVNSTDIDWDTESVGQSSRETQQLLRDNKRTSYTTTNKR